MDLGLSDKVAFVGGASKGLGWAIAVALAREGAKLAIVARNRTRLEDAAAKLRDEFKVEAKPIPGDLSRTGQVRAAVLSALETFGRVDILVNNAGGPPAGPFVDFSDEVWLDAFKLNFMSAVTATREVLPGMKERGWGRIINMTSIAVKQPLDGLILSNAIRAGVHGWAKSLSNELATEGITVNCVLPGFTLTDRVRSLAQSQAEREGLTTEEVISSLTEAIPMGRMGKPEEIGDLVAFLASPRAAYITGTSIHIDGGFYHGLM